MPLERLSDFANYCRGAKDLILRWQEFQQKLKTGFSEGGTFYRLSPKQRIVIEKAVLSDILSSNERMYDFLANRAEIAWKVAKWGKNGKDFDKVEIVWLK